MKTLDIFDLDIQELDRRLEMAGMEVTADWGSGSAVPVGPGPGPQPPACDNCIDISVNRDTTAC